MASFIVKAGDDLRQEQVIHKYTAYTEHTGNRAEAQPHKPLGRHMAVTASVCEWRASAWLCVKVAMQVIALCQEIFHEEHLDIWLRPYTILCVGDQAGTYSHSHSQVTATHCS